jgi:hypothetical protein
VRRQVIAARRLSPTQLSQLQHDSIARPKRPSTRKCDAIMGNERRAPIQESSLWLAYFSRRYAVLFYGLLLMLVVLPAAPTIGLPDGAIKVLLAGCLVAAVMPNGTKTMRRLMVIGVAALIAVRFAADYRQIPVASGWIVLLWGMIGLLAAAGALRFAVASPIVDAEVVYAVLNTYLLAGLFFGQIYWSLEQAWPGTITGPTPLTSAASVYYSFVTLATLGYGDFLPRTDMARGIATLEVIGGQLFLAVLVARLIGAFESAKPQ